MIKTILKLFLLVFIPLSTIAQGNENYMLVIGNDTISIGIDKDKVFKTPNGETLNLKLVQPETLIYSDDFVSFKYNKGVGVSKTALDGGIEQCVLINSVGNGFIVQEYSTMNPTMLQGILLNELTKESVSYGYTREDEDFERTLSSGQTLTGTKATLRYKGERQEYLIAGYGNKDEGILVITMLLTNWEEDQKIIDKFLDSLTLKE